MKSTNNNIFIVFDVLNILRHNLLFYIFATFFLNMKSILIHGKTVLVWILSTINKQTIKNISLLNKIEAPKFEGFLLLHEISSSSSILSSIFVFINIASTFQFVIFINSIIVFSCHPSVSFQLMLLVDLFLTLPPEKL